MKLARSTFYYWSKALQRPDKYEQIKQHIQMIYQHHKGRYGYRRITCQLKRYGYAINHKTVQRLMRQLKLTALIRCKKYQSYKGAYGKTAPNLLDRKFNATKPNQKWVTDVTEFNVHGKKLYLSPILDLFNGEVIAWQSTEIPNQKMIAKMVDMAFMRLGSKDSPILHSDQGWQYQMRSYQNRLKQTGIEQSMSRKGNCLDNAVIENFFGLLKSELFYLQQFDNIDQLKCSIDEYIYYYNNERIKMKLGGLSPVEYRTQSCLTA
ncbi:hypothetical protein F950_00338 [Acinetobacter soli NIPH 2899]|uniref:Integrase catalytic domain-containing protein n=2 Tax=Acinetobacter soli TaxID=487316 RepID=A0ABP2U6M5_9GAMM|nr:hypothetical protein F950_02951 [Acinetobacter soli NIPH 2899]ENV61084.1 hypothetical protein F950_00338 [Acinetobacter soli NIPH 2899]